MPASAKLGDGRTRNRFAGRRNRTRDILSLPIPLPIPLPIARIVADSSGRSSTSKCAPSARVRPPCFSCFPSSLNTPSYALAVLAYTRMKRQALEKRLRECAWSFLPHGRRHDIWTNGRLIEAIPRHVEINDRLARAIVRRAKEAAT